MHASVTYIPKDQFLGSTVPFLARPYHLSLPNTERSYFSHLFDHFLLIFCLCWDPDRHPISCIFDFLFNLNVCADCGTEWWVRTGNNLLKSFVWWLWKERPYCTWLQCANKNVGYKRVISGWVAGKILWHPKHNICFSKVHCHTIRNFWLVVCLQSPTACTWNEFW